MIVFTNNKFRRLWVSNLDYVTGCRLCNSTVAQENLPEESLLKAGQRIKICNLCGFIYISPLPSEEMLDRFYRDIYRKIYTFESALDYGPNFAKKSGFDKIARERVSILKKFVVLQEFSGNVLELGSGYGAFLKELESASSACLFAIEPDVAARNVFQTQGVTFLELEELAPNSIDVFCAFHVFEHLLDPRSVLVSISQSLKNNGLVFLEVPNAWGLVSDWGAYAHVAHVNHFTTETINNLLEYSNLEVLQIWEESSSDLLRGNVMAVARKRADYLIEPRETPPSHELCAALAKSYFMRTGFKQWIKSAIIRLLPAPLIGAIRREIFYRRYVRKSN
jgi:SAM-dependent methyltransferase